MYKNVFKYSLMAPMLVSLASCSLIFGGKEDVRTPSSDVDVKAFKEVPVNFTHVWNQDAGYPYTGAAAIDINQDGAYEVFIGGGDQQDDVLLSYQNGELKNIIEDTGLSAKDATFGSVSVDIDNDNDTDLLVVRDSGVYAYLNNKGKFKVQQIDVEVPEESVPLSVAVGDINRDGLVDLYISCFVEPSKFVASTFNDAKHSKGNVMLLNKGDMKFEDITQKSNTAGNHNTFHSVFVDLNDDGHQDLVLAQNTGVIEIFKNRGDNTFDTVNAKSGLGYWMGIGAGDIDNDGDMDLFLSNVGNSIPEKYLRGDLKEDQPLTKDWAILRNQGNFQFENATQEYELDGYGFAWGGVFEDINLDGKLDLLVAQNYVKWPKHKVSKLPGKAMLQLNEDDKDSFFQVEDLGLNNEHYGQSPLIVDLNADGKPDVFMINMNDAQKAFINQSENNYLKVTLPDTSKYMGASVEVETEKGQLYKRQLISNLGLMTDSSAEIFFGLGQDNKVTKLTITPVNEEPQVIVNPALNHNIVIKN